MDTEKEGGEQYLPLFIQKVWGGGSPGGGLQVSTSGDPSVTTTGSRTSLGHSGDSVTDVNRTEQFIKIPHTNTKEIHHKFYINDKIESVEVRTLTTGVLTAL